MIIKQLKIGPDRQCCYLVGDEETLAAAVIDPPGKARFIVDEARRLGWRIAYIFNTHYHADHTGGNKKLKSLTGAKLVIHAADARTLRKRVDLIKLWFGKLALSPKPDVVIEEETEIRMGSLNFRIFHTPGHTPGGLCYYAAGNLFSGDTLFVGGSGATNFPGGDRPRLGATLRRLMTALPDETVVWPGHDYGERPSSTIGWEKKHNMNAKEYGFYEE